MRKSVCALFGVSATMFVGLHWLSHPSALIQHTSIVNASITEPRVAASIMEPQGAPSTAETGEQQNDKLAAWLNSPDVDLGAFIDSFRKLGVTVSLRHKM
jgi:hypothetical protein